MFSGFPALVQDGALTKAEALELTTNSTLILVGDKQAAQPLFSSINLSGGVSNKTVNNILISAGNNADQVVFLSATQYSGGTFVTGFLKEADVFTGVFSTLDNNGSFVGPIWTTSPSWGYPEYQAVDGDVTPGGLACIATNGINGSSVDGLIIRLKPLADLNVGEDPMLKLITQSNTTYTAAIAQSDESCIGVGWQNLGAGQFGLALMKMSATGTKSWFISHSPGSLGGTDARLIDIAMNGSTLAGLVEVDGNIMLVVIDPSSGSISQKSGSLAMGTAKFIETSADGNYFIGGQAAGKALVQKISASNFSVLWNTLLATSGSIAIDLAEASNGALYIAGTEGSDSWIRLLNSNGVEQ